MCKPETCSTFNMLVCICLCLKCLSYRFAVVQKWWCYNMEVSDNDDDICDDDICDDGGDNDLAKCIFTELNSADFRR